MAKLKVTKPIPADETASRGSREVWLAAAYDALIASGVDSVRIQPLAKILDLSRTSFYWFFSDRDELLRALLDQWKAKNTQALQDRSEAFSETIAEAMLNVFDCWLDTTLFDAQFEFAVRSWALQSPEVAAEIREADEARIAALTAMFRRFGLPETSAEVRARTVCLVQIGYISMNTQESLEVRMKRIPAYIEVYTGQAPQHREMERFAARHGFRLDQADNGGDGS